jgi:hypothetical protein
MRTGRLLSAMISIAVLSIVVAACGAGGPGLRIPFLSSSETPTAQPTQPEAIATLPPIQLTPTRAAIVGQVVTTDGGVRKPYAQAAVRLGPVHWNQDKSQGAFVFEGTVGPVATSNADGRFAFANVPPGDYVIMVGDPMGEYEIISESDGKAKMYPAPAGKPLDVGTIEVKLAPPS